MTKIQIKQVKVDSDLDMNSNKVIGGISGTASTDGIIKSQLSSKVDGTGTGSSTDNAVVKFNGVTGDVEESGVIIDDIGNIFFTGITIGGVDINDLIKPLTDGETWNENTLPVDLSWKGIAYGNGTFVAISVSGGGTNVERIITSNDGVRWYLSNAPVIAAWYNVSFGNGIFIALGENSVITSPDGVNWTSRTPDPTTGMDWRDVVYGEGKFVAVSRTGTNNRVMTSSDGITWTNRTQSGCDYDWRSICYSDVDLQFVAVSGVAGSTSKVMTSPDGITFTPRTAANSKGSTRVRYGNGLYLSGSDTLATSAQYSYSTDGITWNEGTINGTSDYASSMIYAKGHWFIGTYSGHIYKSVNGINSWSVVKTGSGCDYWNAVFGNNVILFLATNEAFIHSSGVPEYSKTH